METIWEYNEEGGILWDMEVPGVCGRAATIETAKQKLYQDRQRYFSWIKEEDPLRRDSILVVQEQKSDLAIHDADTDILFASERTAMRQEEYLLQKQRVIQSAKDFQQLYDSIPEKRYSDLPKRKTFYGWVPRSPKAMLKHTNQVTSYYMGEIGVILQDKENLVENRQMAFELLERQPDFLNSAVRIGHGEEAWSLRKVLRRFIWHDAIHAKAMYRLALRTWDASIIANPFRF